MAIIPDVSKNMTTMYVQIETTFLIITSEGNKNRVYWMSGGNFDIYNRETKSCSRVYRSSRNAPGLTCSPRVKLCAGGITVPDWGIAQIACPKGFK